MKKTLLTLALALATGAAQAIPLSDLLQGGSLEAGDKHFSDWSVVFAGASDPNFSFDYTQIDVTPLHDGGDDPGPGIRIDLDDQMTVTGDGDYAYRDLTLKFMVSVLDPNRSIVGNLLDFSDGYLSWKPDNDNDLGIAVQEKVYTPSNVLLAEKYIESSLLDNNLKSLYPDSATITPQDSVWVVKNMLVWARDTIDTASLRGIEQRFSQKVPEPATLGLLALGLAGLGLARLRKTA